MGRHVKVPGAFLPSSRHLESLSLGRQLQPLPAGPQETDFARRGESLFAGKMRVPHLPQPARSCSQRSITSTRAWWSRRSVNGPPTSKALVTNRDSNAPDSSLPEIHPLIWHLLSVNMYFKIVVQILSEQSGHWACEIKAESNKTSP